MRKLLMALIGRPGKPRWIFFVGLLASAVGGSLWADGSNAREHEIWRKKNFPENAPPRKVWIPETVVESAGLWAACFTLVRLARTKLPVVQAAAGGALMGAFGSLAEDLGKVFQSVEYGQPRRWPNPKHATEEAVSFGLLIGAIGLLSSCIGWLIGLLPRKAHSRRADSETPIT